MEKQKKKKGEKTNTILFINIYRIFFEPTCKGVKDQEDAEIHEEDLICNLTPGEEYLFWVVVDYNHDGTEAINTTPGGILMMPQGKEL